jgi:hypothetical protein
MYWPHTSAAYTRMGCQCKARNSGHSRGSDEGTRMAVIAGAARVAGVRLNERTHARRPGAASPAATGSSRVHRLAMRGVNWYRTVVAARDVRPPVTGASEV